MGSRAIRLSWIRSLVFPRLCRGTITAFFRYVDKFAVKNEWLIASKKNVHQFSWKCLKDPQRYSIACGGGLVPGYIEDILQACKHSSMAINGINSYKCINTYLPISGYEIDLNEHK